MKLHVTSEYRCRNTRYLPGQTIEVSGVEADWLMRDAPGCFSKDAPKEPAKILNAKDVQKLCEKAGVKSDDLQLDGVELTAENVKKAIKAAKDKMLHGAPVTK
jgi:hypothetical protein